VALFGELSYCVSHQITCCLHHYTDKERKGGTRKTSDSFFCFYLVVSIEYCLFDETETRALFLFPSLSLSSCNQLFHHQLPLSLLGSPTVSIAQ
jgi:hypothetical protein